MEFRSAGYTLIFMMASSSRLFSGGYELLTIQEVVTLELSSSAGRQVSFSTDLSNQVNDWVFLCGDIYESDGSEFNMENSPLSEQPGGPGFCALLQTSSETPEILELDIGNTDMPAMDWVSRYGLPQEILDSP